MIIRILVIILIACFVFWLIKRVVPALRAGGGRRIIPLIMNPLVFTIIRRIFTILLRLFLRR